MLLNYQEMNYMSTNNIKRKFKLFLMNLDKENLIIKMMLKMVKYSQEQSK